LFFEESRVRQSSKIVTSAYSYFDNFPATETTTCGAVIWYYDSVGSRSGGTIASVDGKVAAQFILVAKIQINYCSKANVRISLRTF